MTFARETSGWISEFTRRELINRQLNVGVDVPTDVAFGQQRTTVGFSLRWFVRQ